MKIQKEFDPIQGTTTVRIEKTREDVTPVVTYKEFISKGIENADGEIVNQRLENVLPENVATTLFQETLSDGTDIKAAVAAVTAKATIEYAEKNGQRAVIEMKYRQPTGEAASGSVGKTVATPRIAIDADGNVTITAAEGDIFYTTNGSNPTSSSTAYTAAFAVADGTVVKAIAVVVEADPETGDDVEYVSSVATKKYTAAGSSDPTPPSGKFTVYFGSIYNTDPDDDNLDSLAAISDEEFAAKITGDDPLWGGDSQTVQASTLRNLTIQLPVASHGQDAYMWKFVAAPTAKVPAGFTIVEEQTKGEQTPIITRTVTIGGVEYTAFYGFTDTDLKIILDYHA